MSRFTNDTLTVLQRAGWSESRRIDPAPYVQCLEEEGFTVFPAVVDFLREFGELEIWHVQPRSYRVGGVDIPEPENIVFGKHRAARFNVCERGGSTEIGEELEELIGATVCTIGTDENGLVDLWMDVSGNVYVTSWDTVTLLGSDVEEGIEAIIHDTAKWSVPWPDEPETPLLVRSFDQTIVLAEFYPSKGKLVIVEPLSSTGETDRPVCGVYVYLGTELLVLYRQEDRLLLRVHNTTSHFPHVRVDHVEKNGQTTLEIWMVAGQMEYEFAYPSVVLDPPLSEDPTPFVEPEFYDFGLFLYNLNRDRARQKRIFV